MTSFLEFPYKQSKSFGSLGNMYGCAPPTWGRWKYNIGQFNEELDPFVITKKCMILKPGLSREAYDYLYGLLLPSLLPYGMLDAHTKLYNRPTDVPNESGTISHSSGPDNNFFLFKSRFGGVPRHLQQYFTFFTKIEWFKQRKFYVGYDDNKVVLIVFYDKHMNINVFHISEGKTTMSHSDVRTRVSKRRNSVRELFEDDPTFFAHVLRKTLYKFKILYYIRKLQKRCIKDRLYTPYINANGDLTCRYLEREWIKEKERCPDLYA